MALGYPNKVHGGKQGGRNLGARTDCKGIEIVSEVLYSDRCSDGNFS